MLKKVTITISPLEDEKPTAKLVAPVSSGPGATSTARPSAAEMLMVPRSYRLLTESLVGIVVGEGE